LLETAGVALPEIAVRTLHERTEGWAAGLRLAALSLAGNPHPERFATEFSGSERTVAEYLLAEVLERQPAPIRRLLLRTSVLERVNGDLADLLTGDDDGGRVLLDLEQANAFVVSLDSARSWFRYHHMFADLLQLELRRAEPGEVVGLHRSAADWFAENGFALEAISHAQAARDWPLAARLLTDHWPSPHLDGQGATVHAAVARFPARLAGLDAGLAVVAAADELGQGSLEAAEHFDPRVDPFEFLGLDFADAIVGRTVGGRITPAMIQDVAYIGYLVGQKSPGDPTSKWQSSTTPNVAAASSKTRNSDTVSPNEPDTTSRCSPPCRPPIPHALFVLMSNYCSRPRRSQPGLPSLATSTTSRPDSCRP
jgi:hypothetical protein